MLLFLLLSAPAVSVLAHSLSRLSRRSRCPIHATFNVSESLQHVHPAPVSSNLSCFPALGFTMPSLVPDSTDGWWCEPASEYAFVGFSYEVTACTCAVFNRTVHSLTPSTGQSSQQLKKDFADIRTTFHSRYVRLYGACDRDGFYDDVVDAAWDNTLGVHALIWVSLHARRTPIPHPCLKPVWL